MKRRWCAGFIPFLLMAVPALRGQQANMPRVGYVYPAGGQKGSTVQVEIGGQFLDGVSAALISGHGIEVKVIGLDKPLTGMALTAVRDTLQAMQKRPITPALQKEMVALRDRATSSVRRNGSPSLAERVTLEITVAPNAERGERQLRLQTPLGLTGPLVFCVGELPELREKDVKNSAADMETLVTLPVTVNGRLIPGDIDQVRAPARVQPQYSPGDVDRYRFSAHKGQNLVFAVSARSLMPYLADAVPGWIQATLTLYDGQGRELASNDDFRFSPDPVLHYEVPIDGEYVLEIKDAIYRGREDFVYRIAMGELPYVTSVFPLGGRAGASHTIEVAGWNLPTPKLEFDAKKLEAGLYTLSVPGATIASNRFSFVVDALPEVVEKEGNNSPKDAQSVKLPVIVNGRIDRPGDVDVFRFDGRAGDTIVAEVTARRMGSPFDSAIELTNDAGQRIAFNDDHDDAGADRGRETHHADSFVLAALPANGKYFIRVYDVQHKGGPEYAYRLRVSAPNPDFELRVSPSGINVLGGGTVPVTVTALRRDGFTGDVSLALKSAPAGLTLSGATIPAGEDQVRMTLTVPPVSAASLLNLRVEGRATIQGKTVTHLATPAEDMTQAFAYHHMVTADDLLLSISQRGGTRVPSKIISGDLIRIPAGGSTRVRASIPPGYNTFENIQFELSDAPAGFTLRDLSVAMGGAQFVLEADSAKIKPGMRGNLIVTISGERVPPANAPNAGARRRVPLGTLPAIAFEIVKTK
jgi:hypothetical protein